MRERALRILGLVLRGIGEEQVERWFGSSVAMRAIFTGMARSFQPRAANGFEGTVVYELERPRTEREPAVWSIEISGARARARPGATSDPELTLRLWLTDFLQVAAGSIDPAIPLLQGRGNIYGSLELATRLPEMFGAARPSTPAST